MSDKEPVTKNSRPLRLTTRFALIGGLTLGLAAWLMVEIDRTSSDADVSSWAEANNVSLTQTIANSIWPAYADHLDSAGRSDPETIRRSAATKRLLRDIENLVAGLDVLKVKLYETGGKTSFSTQLSQIGADYATNERFLIAKGGGNASKLELREKFGAIAGPMNDRWVLSSYIPVVRAADKELLGVAEIYRDVTALREVAGLRRQERAALIGSCLLGVFGLLVGLVWRSDRQITRYHRRELDLVAAAAEANAKNDAKTRFVANLSHEMRTPLNGVLGMANLLAKSALKEKQKNQVETIRRSGTELLSLIDGLLDVANAESGELRLESSDFEIDNLISETIEEFHPAVAEKKIGLSVQLEGDRGVQALGDRMRLRQVISSLVDNAVKFTARGHVEVVADVRKNDDFRVTLKIAVADTGIGIAEDLRSRIFDPFFQADALGSRHYGGAGIGLSLAKEIVQAMGGSIGFESPNGNGARFWIEVPLSLADRGCQRNDDPVRDVSVDPDSARILLAEDNPVNREVMIDHLQALNYRADFVVDGAAAVSAWEKGSYELILMDIQMPGVDGLEATRVIREKERAVGREPVRIVAVTANTRDSDREACLEAGMDDFLGKPFSDDDFEAVLSKTRGVAIVPPGNTNEPASNETIEASATIADERKSGLDDAVVRPLRDNKPELWSRLVDAYLSSASVSISEMTLWLSQINLATVRTAAHTLKSSSANMGAARLSELCRTLETLAASGGLDDAASLVREIVLEYEIVKGELTIVPGCSGKLKGTAA